jgi:hypothetical protein
MEHTRMGRSCPPSGVRTSEICGYKCISLHAVLAPTPALSEFPLSAIAEAAGLWAPGLLRGFTRNPHRVFSIKMASSPSR